MPERALPKCETTDQPVLQGSPRAPLDLISMILGQAVPERVYKKREVREQLRLGGDLSGTA